MIRITNLSKSYAKTKVVDNLSLEIKEGTIFGFLGPNGAGKTTTMKMIVGLATINNGKVEVDGNDLKQIRAREKIGYMPEDPYFYDRLSALEFLRFMDSLFSRANISPRHSDPRTGVRGKLHGGILKKISRLQYHTARDDKEDKYERLNNLLSMVGLASVGKKQIGDFSKGMKQRLGLAQALVNDPDYLFLDEPLDGLDPIGRLEFKEIFLKLKKEGKTIFFNSHVLSDVEEICDQIGIINKGKLIYNGSVRSFCKGKPLEKRFVEIVANPKSKIQIP